MGMCACVSGPVDGLKYKYTNMCRCMVSVVVSAVLLWSSIQGCASSLEPTSDIVQELFTRIQKLQVKKATKFIPLIELRKDKGVYESYVKVNFHGTPIMAAGRDDASVFDNNMFATSWVTIALLEARAYGNAPAPSSEQLGMSLDAISNHRDKNREFVHSLMVFWPQIYNETVKTYQSTPQNLIAVYRLLDHLPMKDIEAILKWLGFDKVEEFIAFLMEMEDVFLNAFRIPPDFDDTFVNLGLGSLLTQLKSEFPTEFGKWTQDNKNLTSILDALKKYAYRPFSNDSNVNSIDPRTYFYLRRFLDQARVAGSGLSLVPTWIQDIDETRYMYARGDVMPFNINNVDVTVAANTVFGMTSAVVSGVLPADILNDLDLQQILLNTSSMIAFAIETNLTNRRDLALTYYPSLFEFYWFVARTAFLLNTREHAGELPHKCLYAVQEVLSRALRGAMTSSVLKSGKTEGDGTYFDDFLGDGDVDSHNKSLIRAEDRIFTTSMATNALLKSWTYFDKQQNSLYWVKETPAEVKDTVNRSVTWLVSNTLSGKYKPWNAFFSGSGKGHESMPFWFPANRMEYLNGTKIPDDKHFPESPWILGFQGVVPESQYLQMCNKTHFGERTPMDFPGFNVGDGYFPFWTSDAYTYASVMLSIAQWNNIAN